jgi:hypothetical protein
MPGIVFEMARAWQQLRCADHRWEHPTPPVLSIHSWQLALLPRGLRLSRFGSSDAVVSVQMVGCFVAAGFHPACGGVAAIVVEGSSLKMPKTGHAATKRFVMMILLPQIPFQPI